MCDTISRIIRRKTHIFGIVLKENDIIYAKVICLVYFITKQSSSRYKRQSYHREARKREKENGHLDFRMENVFVRLNGAIFFLSLSFVSVLGGIFGEAVAAVAAAAATHALAMGSSCEN